MAYWNPKDHSSYDNRLRDWNVGSDVPRINYGFDLKLPAGAWRGAVAPAPPSAAPAARSSSAGTVVGALAALAVAAALAWLTADDGETAAPPETPDQSGG